MVCQSPCCSDLDQPRLQPQFSHFTRWRSQVLFPRVQGPCRNEMEHILEQDLPTGKRLTSNSGKEGVDCVTVRTGKKEKANNKKENKFFSSSIDTTVNTLQTMLGSCSSSRWLHRRPNHQQTQNFWGSILTGEFFQSRLSTLGVMAGLHAHTR